MKKVKRGLVLLVAGFLSVLSCSQFLSKSSNSENTDSAVLAARFQNLSIVRLKVTGNAQLTGSLKNASVQARTIPTSGSDAGKCDGAAGNLLANGFTSYGTVDKNDGGSYSLSMEKPSDSTICVVITPTPESTAYSPFQKKLIPWRPKANSNGGASSVRVASVLVLSDANSVTAREFKASGNINPLTNMASAKFSSALRKQAQLQKRSLSGEIQYAVLSPADIEKLVSNSNEAIGEMFFKGSGKKVDPSKMNFGDPSSPGYDPGLAKQFSAVMGGIDAIIGKLISGKGLNTDESDDISTLYDSYLDLVGGDIAGDGILDGQGIVDESGNPVTVPSDFTTIMTDPAGSLSQGMSTYVTQVASTGGNDGSGVVWTAADTSNPNFTGAGITASIPAPTAFSYAGSPYIYVVGLPITSLNPVVAGTVTSYTISPALPSGLSISNVSGIISGTPTIPQAAKNYTITATNSSGSAITTVSFAINLQAPNSLTYGASNYVFLTGTAITSLTNNVVGTVSSYSVLPALPSGLSLNSTTGVISGTPMVSQTATNYIITANNSGGSSTTTISITINLPAPNSFTYGGINYTYIAGNSVTALTPSVAGTISSYSVLPTLPTGLLLNTTTGVISGTPTISQVAKNYTITATNSGGATTATISITINIPAPSSLTYGGTNFVYTVGTVIANLSSSVTGTISSYTVSPVLPSGLILNSSTGFISGTPTTPQAMTSYTVTATNSSGSTTTGISITINLAVPVIENIPAPSSLTYGGTNFVYTVGTVIANLSSSVTGTISSYTVSPALPSGLILNSSSGVISGTPATHQAMTSYTVTATNSSGSTTTAISITVNLAIPSSLTYGGTNYTYITGTTIANLTPTVTGTVSSYSITPALPTGLSLDTVTGIISGVPTVAQGATARTIMATNSSGSTTATITIAVNALAISYTGSPFVFANGATITSMSVSNNGSAVSYAIAPALPTGLSLNTSTGLISGTPTVASGATAYTVTVTANSGVTATAGINITVYQPITISYTGSPFTYNVSSAIASLTPTVTNGPSTGYSISPALSAGLSFNTTTGVISGTPSAAQTITAYTISTTSASNGNATTIISVTVNPIPAPSGLSYSVTNPTYYQNVPATTNTATVTGMGITFSVSPSLPTGLTLNTSTGGISGTPTSTQSSTAYTVTATNSTGTANVVMNITISVMPAGCSGSSTSSYQIAPDLWLCAISTSTTKTWTDVYSACNNAGNFYMATVSSMTRRGLPTDGQIGPAMASASGNGYTYVITGQPVRLCYWNRTTAAYEACGGLGYIATSETTGAGANWVALVDGNSAELRAWPSASTTTGYAVISLCQNSGADGSAVIYDSRWR